VLERWRAFGRNEKRKLDCDCVNEKKIEWLGRADQLKNEIETGAWDEKLVLLKSVGSRWFEELR
jgi:hypothetical protein